MGAFDWQAAAFFQSGMTIRLSVCPVTIDRARIERFFAHHLPAAQKPGVEWLIFCEEADAAAIRAEWSDRYPTLRVFADDGMTGLNEKRNRLLDHVAGESVVFLDDDSFIDDPAPALDRMIAEAKNHPWLLLTTRFHDAGAGELTPPKSFRTGDVGSGIEWNQVYRTSLLREVGGWDPRFGPGKPWPSGEAFVLMFNLHRRGHRQHFLPEVVVSHPAQTVSRDFSNLRKFRRYRYALGMVLLSLRRGMPPQDFATWLIRFTVLPLAGSVSALWKRDFPLAALRLLAPVDVITGMAAFFKTR